MNLNLIIAVIIFALVLLISVLNFKEWLKWAVTQAEADLGSGTGQLKLREVYDLATVAFPVVSKLIPFALFSKMVDAALKWMNYQIENNPNFQAIVCDSQKGE